MDLQAVIKGVHYLDLVKSKLLRGAYSLRFLPPDCPGWVRDVQAEVEFQHSQSLCFSGKVVLNHRV